VRLKSVVVAPMPSAISTTMVAENPPACASDLTA
jgi:hypothetical protein